MLPDGFTKRMQALLGADFDAFAASYDRPRSVGLRLNPLKTDAPPALAQFGLSPVPWAESGFYYDGASRPGLSPYHDAGLYYLQEPSAMAPAGLLDVHPGERVLDLCAAPGGKSTQLAAALRGEGLLVCNEIHPKRARILSGNIERLGIANALVLNEHPKQLAERFPCWFDKILVDAPCSGEGMFRKDAKAVKDWSGSTVNLCSTRQKRILADVWPSLRNGGVLVYSTCTFEEAENDAIMEWTANELGGGIYEYDYSALQGVVATRTGGLLVPGFVKGEGQFVSALVKNTGSSGFRLPGKPAVGATERKKGNLLIHIPESIAREVTALDPLHPIQAGVAKGELKGRDLVPSADWALSLAFPEGSYPVADLDREAALKFLHRDSIFLKDAPKGFVLVRFDGHPLGFVKNLGTRCNNLHPQGRKIKMDV